MLQTIWPRLTYFLNDFSLYILLLIVSFFLTSAAVYKIYKSKLSSKNKRITTSLVFTLFAIILVFSLFEAYFRYIYDESDGLGFLKVNSRWHQRHIVTNNYFFRDRDFEPKKENFTRIGVLGDSITVGGGIENTKDRFSDILERKLKESGYNGQVYNLGKLGYDTEGEIKEYEKVKHLDFDIIIWQYFLNDIQPHEKSTGTPIISQNSRSPQIISFLSEKSFFVDFLYWRLSPRYQKTFSQLKQADLAQYQNESVLKNHQQEIADFIQSLKKENKKVVVVIFPFVHLLGPDYPAAQIHKQMGEYFQAQDATVVDLLDDLINQNPKNLIASRFDPHPNETVHRLAAEKLFVVVKSLLE